MEKCQHTFIATVLQISGNTAQVEPVEYEREQYGARISFEITNLPSIDAEVGSVVEITYRGGIRETYPATVDAVAWKITRDLRHLEYTEQWLDSETVEKLEPQGRDVQISAIYADCFFGYTVSGKPFEVKINYALSEEWCVRDLVYVEFSELFRDDSLRYEGKAGIVRESDYQWDQMAAAKPVVYLYPEEETAVSVKLAYDGKLTCTYPAYGDGWKVTAKPDGTLTDAKGQTYNYLYWEGESYAPYDLSKGFCVTGADTAAFLEDALAKLGLNRREANEFIVYWLPMMEGNAYNLISFDTATYEASAKLKIDPAPDTLIRVFMTWQPSEEYVEMEPMELTVPQRSGFTAVEWGGTEIGGE